LQERKEIVEAALGIGSPKQITDKPKPSFSYPSKRKLPSAITRSLQRTKN
jgi:hypothetical protein